MKVGGPVRSDLSVTGRVRRIILLAGGDVTADNGCHGFCARRKEGVSRAVSPHANDPITRALLDTAVVTSSYVATST